MSGTDRVWVAGALFLLGVSQMAGDVLGVPVLRGLGAASAAAPAPKVFTAVRGYEPFSTRFFLEHVEGGRVTSSLAVTPERYAQVRGPYNRRNVYGAALSYAPVLPSTLRDPVMHFGLCGEAALLRELDAQVPQGSGAWRVRLEPREGAPEGLLLTFEVRCP